MRALEAFHEAEQVRLALRETLRVQRAVEEADREATPPLRRSPGVEEADDGKNAESRLEKAAVQFTEGHVLLLMLPDAIVLDEIVGNYLDFDTIFEVLPQLSKDWQKVIIGEAKGALLWKKLCVRAWEPLHLPIKVNNQDNDWQNKFLRRPRVRLSGPYLTYTVFIQYPGPRSMWTPKDAPAIKVVHHYRFWWFREDNQVLYIALATRTPEKIIELMRKEILHPGTGSNSPEVVFWPGSYSIYRDDGRLVCDVDVPQARHGVKFKFVLCPGGRHVQILSHRSYRFKTPLDYMNHPLPECEEDRLFRYRPGFL